MFRKTAPQRKSPDGATIAEAGPCEKRVRLQVPPAEIAALRAAVTGEFQKDAVLPGFRKGKVPADLITQRFAKEIHDETLQRATRQAIEQAAKAHGLKPVGPFEIGRADYQEAQGLTLEATVEVEPEFPLGGYRQIPLTRPSDAVSADDIAQAMAKLQESMAQMVPVPPPTGEAGASAQLVGGPVAEGAPKERRVPALDDELAKDLGFSTLDKLREHVESKLREQRRAAQRQALESTLGQELLKRHSFQVPAKLVAHQAERLTRDFKARLLLSGAPEAEVDAQAGQFTEQLRANAEHLVRLSFILDRVAAQEAITVTQDELVKRLWQLARQWGKDPAQVRHVLDERGLWPSIVSTLRQEKTMAWLIGAAAITNGATPTEVKSQK